MKKNLLCSAISAIFLLSGCSSIPAPDGSYEDTRTAQGSAGAVFKKAPAAVASPAMADKSNALFAAETGRQMAWSAQMTLRVKDIAQTEKQIHKSHLMALFTQSLTDPGAGREGNIALGAQTAGQNYDFHFISPPSASLICFQNAFREKLLSGQNHPF